MIKHSEADVATAQSEQLVAILGDIAERSRKVVEDFVARQGDLEEVRDRIDGHSPLGGAFIEMLTRVMSHPRELCRRSSACGRTMCASGRARPSACSASRPSR